MSGGREAGEAGRRTVRGQRGGIFEQEVLSSVEVVTVFGDAGSQPFVFFVMLP